MSPAASSRWCPTPDQLMILEELYRSGIRTPNASQIQRITAHLSLYGKIEGKNVFYWFQNHKARDRQKLRRKLLNQLQQQHQLYYHHRHHNLSSLDPPLPPPPPPPAASSSAFHPLPYHHSAAILPQGGLGLEMINQQPWKMEIPQTENSMVRKMYGQHWMMMMMMMMEVGDLPTPCITGTRPLETLELFPITATNLKQEEAAVEEEDCNLNNTSSSSSSSSSNNSNNYNNNSSSDHDFLSLASHN